MSAYEVGDTFYKKNKNGTLEKVEIVDILYKFNKRIGSFSLLTCEQINKCIDDEKLYQSEEEAKQIDIQKLEKKYGITLKEI